MTVVLVAEADPEVAELFRMYLASKGFAVETAPGGLECMERLRRFTPDVLVLDRDLPWGGYDGVLACLRAEGPDPPPAVVLTTGEAERSAEPTDFPVVECLHKPFALAKLLESINDSLAKITLIKYNNMSFPLG